MRILIIGGTGFVSSRLVRRLLDAEHEVTVLTRGRTPLPFAREPRLTVRQGDRRDPRALRSVQEAARYDAVFDMVAYTAADSRLAAEAFRGQVGRFIHCSTISVYMVSDAVHCPVTEDQDDRPVMPHWPHNPFGMDYGIDKRACEEVLWAAHDARTFPVTMLRPTFVSGPGDPARRDYFWIQRILDGKPLLVPGSSDHAFQQVFVEDVARAFADLLRYPEATPGQAYNVASEDVYSLNDYLYRLASLLDRPVELVPVDQAVFDAWPHCRSPHGDVFPFNTRRTAIFSLDRIKRDLGYRSTPFEEWMADTIRWFSREDEAPSPGYVHREEEIAFARRWHATRRQHARAFSARLDDAGTAEPR